MGATTTTSRRVGARTWAESGRRIGHVTLSLRTRLDERFGQTPNPVRIPLAGGRYAVESYLDHQAEKLVQRFDANSYLVLSRAMDHHDLGRDRGGIGAALARVRATTTVAGVDSDRLYPLRLQVELAARLPDRPQVDVVSSLHGHDAFLVEQQQVTRVIRRAMDAHARSLSRGGRYAHGCATGSRWLVCRRASRSGRRSLCA